MSLYQSIKTKINYMCDRVIERIDLMLMDIEVLPYPAITHPVARFVGDVTTLVGEFPRLSAYQLQHDEWNIIVVGTEGSVQEIKHLFFEETPQLTELGRVALWNLPQATTQWLAEGVDLVISETSRLITLRGQSHSNFTVPTWINQELLLPEPLDSLLSGRHIKSIRHNINRASKSGFGWYASQAREDFDYFYHRMYVPFISSRHAERALVATYDDQMKKWFTHGGLIMVTQHQQPVAGLLGYLRRGRYFAVEIGVLDHDETLLKDGIKLSADWFAMNWAYQQGARLYNMGGTRPWCSDGVFVSKSRWRAKVIRRRKIYPQWRFAVGTLSLKQQAFINKLGLITEIGGLFFRVHVLTLAEKTPDLTPMLAETARQGLAGIATVSADDGLQIYRS